MKKTLRNLFLTCLLLAIALSCVGCAFVAPNQGGTSGGSGAGGGTPSGLTQVLPDSVIAGNSNVVINSASTTRESEPMTLKEAANMVKRSSVAIQVKDNPTSTSSSTGSGVIVDMKNSGAPDNIIYIITCFHMIENKGTITVHIPDHNFQYGVDEKWTFTGVIGGTKEENSDNAVKLIGGDFTSDVAILSLDLTGSGITSQDIVKAKIMDSQYSVSYGEEVFAIGNPSGTHPGSLNTGRISYVYRTVSVDEIGTMVLHQIDVSTNHGSSGGGLYNLYGELIGITNAGNDGYTNLNYAIPCTIPTSAGGIDNGFVNISKQLLGAAAAIDFENYGYISGRRVMFGFTVATTNSQATIISVEANSIAQSLNMEAGDIIASVDLNGVNTVISSSSEFSAIMATLSIGDSITLNMHRIYRGATYTYTATLTLSQYYFCDTGVYPQE